MSTKGIGGHQKPNRGASDDWLTPPDLLRSLGPFDLDPCCPRSMPWETAGVMLHAGIDDGLSAEWFGRVWLNPPYGPQVGEWVGRLAQHGNGVALIFARTETEAFHSTVFERADAILFLRGRLHFHRIDGIRAKFNAGAPSCLVAYGKRNVESLKRCGLDGKFLTIPRGEEP